MTVHTLKIPFFIQSGPTIWIPKHPNHYVYPLVHIAPNKTKPKNSKPQTKTDLTIKIFSIRWRNIKKYLFKCYHVSQHHLGRPSIVMVEHYNSRVLTSRIQILLLELTFLGNDIAKFNFPYVCNGDNNTSLNHFGFLIISFKKLTSRPPPTHNLNSQNVLARVNWEFRSFKNALLTALAPFLRGCASAGWLWTRQMSSRWDSLVSPCSLQSKRDLLSPQMSNTSPSDFIWI